jgi:hypothetical protein
MITWSIHSNWLTSLIPITSHPNSLLLEELTKSGWRKNCVNQTWTKQSLLYGTSKRRDQPWLQDRSLPINARSSLMNISSNISSKFSSVRGTDEIRLTQKLRQPNMNQTVTVSCNTVGFNPPINDRITDIDQSTSSDETLCKPLS